MTTLKKAGQMRRIAPRIFLALLFLSLFASIFDLQPLEASGMNYLNAGNSFVHKQKLIQGEGLALLEPPSTEWNRTYGGSDIDEAWSVIQTDDGGYAVAGYTCSYTFANTGLADTYLVKTDDLGQLQWNRTHGGPADEVASSVIQTNDGGYALAGYSSSFSGIGDKLYSVKTNSSGYKQWSRTYGGRGQAFGNSIVQTSDGGYALAGVTDIDPPPFGVGNDDMYLVKTDSLGRTQWSRTYGGVKEEGGGFMVQTNDGGYALAGWTVSFGAGRYDMYLVKIDSQGNMQWNKTYGGRSDEWAYSVVQTGDGGYVLAGSTLSFGGGSYDMYLVKTDSTGNMQWNKTYEAQGWEEAWSVVQTNDGGYALAGYTKNIGASDTDAWLVRTDKMGQVQWNRTYGGINEDEARCIIQTSDAGYAMAGLTCSFGTATPDHPDAWLIKIAPESSPAIAVIVNVCPRALNLRNEGRWITAFIELPEGYDIRDIDFSSIMLNNAVPAALRPRTIKGCHGNHKQALMVKFDREAVVRYILGTVPTRTRFMIITLAITGKLSDGTLFQGSCKVKMTTRFLHYDFHHHRCNNNHNSYHYLYLHMRTHTRTRTHIE